MLLLLLGFLVDGGEGLFRLGLGLTGLLLVGLATAGATGLGAGSIAWVGRFGVHGGNWRIAVDGSDFERYWGTEEIAEGDVDGRRRVTGSCHVTELIANIFSQGFNKSARLMNRLHAACRHRDKGYGFVAV